MKNTYKIKTRNITPENWSSGRPVKLFGIYLYTIWTVAKEGYEWQCNNCFNVTVKNKFEICDDCIISKAKKLTASYKLKNQPKTN